MLIHTSLALQSVSMRLSTVSEIGDLVTVLNPARSVLNNIRLEVSSILPEASQELGNIGSLLSEIVTTTNLSTDTSVNIGKASPEAEEILAEAESLAEKRLEDQLPKVAPERNIKKLANVEA
jgi:division protein CdvB (Snf7/Vps24/ESCRT-III family)